MAANCTDNAPTLREGMSYRNLTIRMKVGVAPATRLA
jgi:hypothetical protein